MLPRKKQTDIKLIVSARAILKSEFGKPYINIIMYACKKTDQFTLFITNSPFASRALLKILLILRPLTAT